MNMLVTGQLIDGFRLEEQLHRGGMADLWRVSAAGTRDSGLPLIMKLPRLDGSVDAAAIVGFEMEQMILPLLHGPHVPRFLAKSDQARQPYLVMEGIAGTPLQSRLLDTPLAVDEVVDIGVRVATALHDLHRQHVVHLDVKPGNILLRPGGTAVLVDYGVSHHQQLPDLLAEEFEVPVGTGTSMSPEQVQFVRNDPRSDIFSLGVMLYRLLTGAWPFGEPHTVRELRRRLYRDPVPPQALRADCPPWLQEILLRCLEINPDQRYATAAQLAFELRHTDLVALTERALRSKHPGGLRALRRWWTMVNTPHGASSGNGLLARSPIVVAALNVVAADPALLATLRIAVQRQLQAQPNARLACVAVLDTPRLEGLPASPTGPRHVDLLVQLKHWAQPLLNGHQSRVTFHVLESHDAASALIDFATKNHVDHIIMGARASGRLRQHLGSVSAQVAAQAACNVTVVRSTRPSLVETTSPRALPPSP